jgi:agmatinase
VEENLRRISDVVSYFREKGKITIGIGGEHTVTPGIIDGFRRATKNPPCVLSIDAHMDLRDDYMGYKYDHACAMRRVHELGAKVVLVGVRAFTKEELDFARKNDIPFVTSLQAESMGTNWLISYVSRALEECKEVYVTYDMDGFDPAYAPGVATPEPEGLRPTTVLDLINGIADERFSGFDVVEVSPPFDYGGITAVLAGRLILETSTVIYKSRFLK